MMERCRTCSWFHPDSAPKTEKAGWGFCDLAATNDGKRPEHQESLAIAVEEWSANLYVSPDFGCVQHEAKP